MKVNVPGVGVVDFPDDMSPTEIKSAIEQTVIPHAQAQATPKASPVSDSGVENFFAGLGKNMTDLGLGAKQFGAEALAKVIPGMQGTADALRQEATQKKAIDAPLMGTKAGFAGNMAGDVGAGLVTLPIGGVASGLGRLGLAALGGAGQEALKPVGDGDSRLTNAALGAAGGAVGQGIANVAGAVVRPAVAGSPEIQAAKDFADANGGKLTMGQLTDSAFLKRLEKMLASMPGSSKFYKGTAEANENVVDKTVKAITGTDAGAAIQTFGKDKSVTLDPQFFQDMQGIAAKFGKLADRDAPNGALKTIEQYVGSQTPNPALNGFSPSVRAQAIERGVPEFATGQGAFKPGDVLPMVGDRNDFNNYWALRSLYGQRAFGQGDPTDKAAYELIRNAFDRAAIRSAESQGSDPAMLKALRDSYGVERMLDRARVVSPSGEVSYDPKKAANVIAQKDAKQASYLDNLGGDQGQQLRGLANFVRVSQPVTSSGTAEGNIAGKVASLEILKDLMSEGVGGAAKTLGSLSGLTMMPWLVNRSVQGNMRGVPGLRDLPDSVTATLGQLARTLPQSLLNP